MKKLIKGILAAMLLSANLTGVYAEDVDVTEEPAEETAEGTALEAEPAAENEEETVGAGESEETDGVVLFVDRAYEVILERIPSEEEKQGWINALRDGSISGAELVQGFYVSDEFKDIEHTTAEIVENVYRSMMGRDPDEEGGAHWEEILESGMTLDYVISRFASSAEFIGICAEYGIEPGTITTTANRDRNANVTKWVSGLYLNVLGRKYDEDGLEHHTGNLVSGRRTAAEVLTTFFTGSEISGQGISDEEYIQRLYVALLGRDADESGLEHWMYVLSVGMTRKYVLAAIVNSPEFTQTCAGLRITRGNVRLDTYRDQNIRATEYIVRLYREGLGREYDESGLENWARKLYTGENGALETARKILTSTEIKNMNLSNEEYAAMVYRTMLGREADEGGLKGWTADLDNGLDREVFLIQFSRAPEYRNQISAGGMTLSTDPAYNTLNSCGWSLRAAYNWVVDTISYSKMTTNADLGSWFFAKYAFSNHTGNCYAIAGTFYFMAKYLGYDVVQMDGKVKNSVTGWNAHSWVDLTEGGTHYIMDPDFEIETGYSGWYEEYNSKGTLSIISYDPMHE